MDIIIIFWEKIKIFSQIIKNIINLLVVQLVKQLLPEIDKNKGFSHKIHSVELAHWLQNSILELQSSQV